MSTRLTPTRADRQHQSPPVAPQSTVRVRSAVLAGANRGNLGHAAALGAIWLGGVVVALFFASLIGDAAKYGDVYIPLTNDSFYHAHRVLDALAGTFQQFDARLQVPEGTWIPWPWAFDYLLTLVARTAEWLAPAADPLATLFWVAPTWLLVNAALFLAVAGEIGLSLSMRAVALLAFALSPLTQQLHAYGMLDHHFVEHTFVLASLWLGLRWFRRLDDWRSAAAVGVVLGVAPGFHTGLFILQIVPLACAFLLWLRGTVLPRGSAVGFALALLAAMQVVLWPSATFRAGFFEFGLLSWFHLYVAACSALCMVYMSRWRFSARQLAVFGTLILVLLAPLVAQILGGADFISGRFSILPEITEARSVYDFAMRSFGVAYTVGWYTWLIALAPLAIVLHGYLALTERKPERLLYSIAVVAGLAMLLAQFRFHYFGFFALVTAPLLALERLRDRFAWHRSGTVATALLLIAAAYQPALRHRLFDIYAPAAEPAYSSAIPLFLKLSRSCAAEPGVVLASSDDGNAILFHTRCSVFANNFILRASDVEHLARVDALMTLTPEQIREAAPAIRYLLVRRVDFSEPSDEGTGKLIAEKPIAKQLFIDAQPPPGFKLLHTVLETADATGPDGIYARLYRIEPKVD